MTRFRLDFESARPADASPPSDPMGAEMLSWINSHDRALAQSLPRTHSIPLVSTAMTEELRVSFFLRRPLDGPKFRALITAELRHFALDHPGQYTFADGDVDTVVSFYLHNLRGKRPKQFDPTGRRQP